MSGGREIRPAAGGTAAAGTGRRLGAARGLAALAAYLLLQIAGGAVVGIAFGAWFAGRGGEAGEAGRAAAVPAAGAGIVLAGWAVRRIAVAGFADRAEAHRALGLVPAGTRACARGAVGGVALAVAYVLGVQGIFPGSPEPALGPIAAAASEPGWTRGLWAILAVGIVPPVEELVFRGVLFAAFAPRAGRAGAAALVTALFVGFHLPEALAYPPAAAAIGAVGAAAVALRIGSGSIVPGMVLHAAYNLGLVAAVQLGGP